jgi:hypothetical protein
MRFCAPKTVAARPDVGNGQVLNHLIQELWIDAPLSSRFDYRLHEKSAGQVSDIEPIRSTNMSCNTKVGRVQLNAID